MRADVLTQRHRAQQIIVQRATVAQVRSAWGVLDWTMLDDTYPDLAAKVALIVAGNRRTSSALASAYVRRLRAKHVRGSFQPISAPPLGADQFNTSLQVTSIIAAKKAASRGVLADLAMRDALVQTAGAMSRLVLGAGRYTVTQTAIRDPKAVGWQRVGIGRCDFCQMLLGRGAVYSEETADFEAHDHCTCSAEPVYR